MTPDRPAKAAQIRERPSALACAVTHNEVEVLEREEPTSHPGIGVFGTGHPLEGRVVGDQGELSAKEIVAQLQYCPLDG